MCGIPMFIIGAISLAAFPLNSTMPVLIILPLAIAGLGFGMAQMIPWLVFPDVVDVAELKSNDRNPGAYNSTKVCVGHSCAYCWLGFARLWL